MTDFFFFVIGCLAFGLVGGVSIHLLCRAYETAVSVWQRCQPKPQPPKWQVTLTDPNGIPMRQEAVSPAGIARLIRDINSGYYK